MTIKTYITRANHVELTLTILTVRHTPDARFASSPDLPVCQLFMVHALAGLTFYHLDLFHLFPVIDRLEKFVANGADLDHPIIESLDEIKA